MSFSSDLKHEIINSTYKNSCCRRALLQGVLASKAIVCENLISLNVDGADTVDFISKLVSEFFGKNATVSTAPKGGRCRVVSFESKATKKFLCELDSAEPYVQRCRFCQAAFLRGIYLACGRTTDPEKRFCLEFSVGNRDNYINSLLLDVGLELKYAKRKTETLLYTKNSAIIEDFFAMAELTEAVFTIMNVKIKNDFKNTANRLRNLDTISIGKVVTAATPQVELIKQLSERNLLSKLPEELIGTALLRLQNPEMSLSQLAMHSVPPLTKSGIKHRIEKIMKLGEELLNK